LRLRELTFPIAVEDPGQLLGGVSAGLGKPASFDWNVASYYLKGGYDDVIIYDSDGRRFEVESIELTSPQWWRYVLDRLGHLIVIPNRDIDDIARVDMVLRQTGTLSLDEFCHHVIQLLLANPTWWKRFSTEARVRKIFEGDETFKDAINHIGVYDPPRTRKLRGRSEKTVDMR